MNHDAVAHNASLVGTVNLTLDNVSSGNGSDLRDLVNLAHLNLTGDNLLLNLIEHTNHGRLNIVDSVVDY